MTPVTAVLLDAMGTLLTLEPPGPRLRAELAARGVAVEPAEATAAMRLEIAHYRTHHDRARDAASLRALRSECAEVVRSALPQAAALGADELVDVLLAALRFTVFPEVPDALRALRASGVRCVVASNWDVSLHEVLERLDLAPLLDGVVTSAEVGVAKPGAGLFAAALERAGAQAAGALHVGDDVELDVLGARAAGLRAVLVRRDDRVESVPSGVPVIGTLAGLPGLAAC